MTPPVVLRDMQEGDLSWVMSSWLQSYRDYATSKLIRQMPSVEYWRRWRNVVEAIMAKSHVTVATPADSTSTILGWICYEDGIVHYVHVKHALQEFGLASILLAKAGFDRSGKAPVLLSHRTTCGDKVPIPPSWVSAPWLTVGLR